MNGIAMDTVSGHFLLTGKNWPDIYEFELKEPVSSSSSTYRDKNMACSYESTNKIILVIVVQLALLQEEVHRILMGIIQIFMRVYFPLC